MSNFLKVFVSELQAICSEASQPQYHRAETGGDLYGVWTDNNTPIIYLATGPGPKSAHRHAEFSQDIEQIQRSEEYLFQSYGLQYLGDWHSHHMLGLEEPSSGDQRRIHHILHSNESRHRMVELIINHHYGREKFENISAFYYEQGYRCRSIDVQLLTQPVSPIRLIEQNRRNTGLVLLNDDFDKGLITLYNQCVIDRSVKRDQDNSATIDGFKQGRVLFNGIEDWLRSFR